jgi:Na+-transporting NADH:ubiquinone oxidoreductase subunit NqrB
MSLRSFLDDIAPSFEKGGKYEALYPAYEAVDTALYTPSSTTAGASHVRDGLNLKRVMITVWLCWQLFHWFECQRSNAGHGSDQCGQLARYFPQRSGGL